MKWSSVKDVVGRHSRRPHAKAVVMFRCDDEIGHAGIFCDRGPFLCIEMRWMKVAGERFVFGIGNPGIGQDPLAKFSAGPAIPFATSDGIKPPVNENPECCLAIPCGSRRSERIVAPC